MLKDVSKKSVWNNTDSIDTLKPFCLNNLVKYLAVFLADLGDLLINIPSPSYLYNPNSLSVKILLFFISFNKNNPIKSQISAPLSDPILTLNNWFELIFSQV